MITSDERWCSKCGGWINFQNNYLLNDLIRHSFSKCICTVQMFELFSWYFFQITSFNLTSISHTGFTIASSTFNSFLLSMKDYLSSTLHCHTTMHFTCKLQWLTDKHCWIVLELFICHESPLRAVTHGMHRIHNRRKSVTVGQEWPQCQ
jgi:hypothetical protein